MRSLLPFVELSTEVPVGEGARVDAEERELTDERVGHDLEGERGKRLFVVGAALDRRALYLRVEVDAFNRRDVERRGQIIDHGIEQRLHALILERRAANDRHERRVFLADRLDRAFPQRRLDFGLSDFFTGQVLLEQLVVGLADLFDQLLAEFLGLVQHLGRNLADDVVGAHRLVLVGERLHPNQIDDPDKLVFGANRELNRNRVALQLRLDLLERAAEVGADAVHLVDEADARHAVLVGLAPHRFRLRLDARDGIKDRARAVEDAQRALDFDGEIHVTGRVDDVDAVIAPVAGGGSGRNRDATLLLLLHPVHHRRAFVDLADLVRLAGIEEDPLGRGRLPGIDVGHDADVPVTL